jgi:DNA-binding response OmpR family regulator
MGAGTIARITVFDDYPDFLDLMRDMLGDQAGHDVTCFDGSGTTLEDIAASEPDLLIVDLRLARQDMSGDDLLTQARADWRLIAKPILVCSSDVRQLEERRAEFRSLGKVWVLPKPFAADELQALVANLVAREVRAS